MVRKAWIAFLIFALCLHVGAATAVVLARSAPRIPSDTLSLGAWFLSSFCSVLLTASQSTDGESMMTTERACGLDYDANPYEHTMEGEGSAKFRIGDNSL